MKILHGIRDSLRSKKRLIEENARLENLIKENQKIYESNLNSYEFLLNKTKGDLESCGWWRERQEEEIREVKRKIYKLEKNIEELIEYKRKYMAFVNNSKLKKRHG